MKQTPETVQTDVQEIAMDVQDEEREEELLGKLVKRGVLELKPTLNKAGIRYIEAEETWKTEDPAEAKDALEDLEKKGALVAKFTDRVLTCPDCSSPEVYSKYACPKCNSINVEYTELLEHMKCGYIGSKNEFVKGSSLACPGCQAELEHDSLKYRVIGNSYQCEKCGYRFDAPQIIHICQQCKRNFTHREAKYVKIYSYKIADETVDKFGKDLPLFESIEEILREHGFATQFHGQIEGTTGVQHPFDIIANKENVLLVADVSLTGDKNHAVSLLGKKMDVNPTHSILIDMSNREELSSLGKVYNIKILNGANEKQLRNELRSFLASTSSTKTQKSKGEKRRNQSFAV